MKVFTSWRAGIREKGKNRVAGTGIAFEDSLPEACFLQVDFTFINFYPFIKQHHQLEIKSYYNLREGLRGVWWVGLSGVAE